MGELNIHDEWDNLLYDFCFCFLGIFVDHQHFTRWDRNTVQQCALSELTKENFRGNFQNRFLPTFRPPEKTRPDAGANVQLRPPWFGVFCFSLQALFAFFIPSSTATIPARAQRSALKNKTSYIGETFQHEIILKPGHEAGVVVLFVKSLEVIDKIN